MILKRLFYIAVFIAIVIMISGLCTVHSKVQDPENYTGGLPVIFGLLNMEFFIAFVFCATIGVYLIIAAILWHYHEIPLHHVQKKNPNLVNVVFGLATCGLIFHKAWFVLAIVIAFMPWDAIARQLYWIIHKEYPQERSDPESTREEGSV